MGKMKEKLIEDMMNHPDIYIEREDYEFWIQCRKEELLQKEEELLERANKPTIKIIRKDKSCQIKKKK